MQNISGKPFHKTMAGTSTLFNSVVNEPSQKRCSGSFIFLHGTGGTGVSMRNGIRDKIKYDFSFPHIRIIFPTAPLMPYTLRGGEPGNVWFDRATLEPTGVEYLSSIDTMAKQLMDMVQTEVDAGIPMDKIIIGGFSMGASMALHLGLRFLPDVAGIVSMSTFLYNDSEVYRLLEEDTLRQLPPVLFCHGNKDELVDIEWGRTTYERLGKLGLQGTFNEIDGLRHTVNAAALDVVKTWVDAKIPAL